MIRDLSWLLHPFDRRAFLNEYLEKNPLVVHRDMPTYYEDLFRWNDAELLLADGPPWLQVSAWLADEELPAWRYSRRQSLDHVDVRTGLDHVAIRRLLYEEGATLRVRNIQELRQPVRSLLCALEGDLGCATDADLLLAASGAKAKSPAYATHDVWLLQVSGMQLVRVYAPVVKLPLGTQGRVTWDCGSQHILFERSLNPGDLVYVPRGFPWTTLESSGSQAVLSLSLYHPTWTRFIMDALYTQAKREPAWRDGYFTSDMAGASVEDKQSQLYQIRQQLLKVIDSLETPEPLKRERYEYQSILQSFETSLTSSKNK